MAAELTPPVRTLMGPGPSDTHPRVLRALARPTVGHLDPYYLQLMDELQKMLRALFRTENRMTFAVSGTGSAGMEATVVNLIEPGDSMIVCVNGVFGGRMMMVYPHHQTNRYMSSFYDGTSWSPASELGLGLMGGIAPALGFYILRKPTP